MNHGESMLLHFRGGLSLCIPETGIMRIRRSQRIRRPQRLLPPFKGEQLEQAQTSWMAPISSRGEPLVSHMIGCKYHVHPDNPL